MEVGLLGLGMMIVLLHVTEEHKVGLEFVIILLLNMAGQIALVMQ
jgi:hypothetical protein